LRILPKLLGAPWGVNELASRRLAVVKGAIAAARKGTSEVVGLAIIQHLVSKIVLPQH
jgi:hypothetical protein